MANPEVSIMIPVYNRENLIGPCIESALKQTHDDFEVVVVDNNSTDKTWEVCKKYVELDQRVRIYRNEKNLGPVRNWSRSFDEARGTIGKLLFSDDLINPDYLASTLPYLKDHQVGFVFTPAVIGKDPRKGYIAYRWRSTKGLYGSDGFIRDLLLSDNVPVSPGAALFRMDDLRNNLMLGIPNQNDQDYLAYGAGADMLLYLHTANQYPLVAYLPNPLVFFRAHESSISLKASVKVLQGQTRVAVWFTENHLDNRLLASLLVRKWLLSMFRERRPLPWRNYVSGYTRSRIKLPIFQVPGILFKEILRKLRQQVLKNPVLNSI